MEEKTVEKTAEKKNDSLLLWMKIQTGLLAAILVLLLAVGTVIGIQQDFWLMENHRSTAPGPFPPALFECAG